MHALYIVVPDAWRHGHRVPLLQRVHRGQGDGARRFARHAGAHEIRRPQLLPDEPLGALRPPFRRHHRRGPAVGPTLAAQFGYAPGLHLAGRRRAASPAPCTTSTVLWASTRRGGRSLAEIARTEIGPVAGIVGAIAILFIVVIALAGLGIVVVNALAESAWGTFTIGMTIPLADLHGLLHVQVAQGPHQARPPSSASSAMLLCVVLGERVAASSFGSLVRAVAAPADGARSASTASPPRCCRSGCC